jgi:hypothetical protein
LSAAGARFGGAGGKPGADRRLAFAPQVASRRDSAGPNHIEAGSHPKRRRSKIEPPATPPGQQGYAMNWPSLRQLAASEASHSEATDALASSEAAISSVNRRLRELAATRARIEQQMTALAAREHDVARRQGSQEEQLNWLLRELQVLSLRDPLQCSLRTAIRPRP